MFEARLVQGKIFKMVVEAMKDLVTDANLDCSKEGISLQAMDSSHVSLVSLLLRGQDFDHYRCDQEMSLGLNMVALSKILKCSGQDDIITISADPQQDEICFKFESPKQEGVAEFTMKLMAIDSESLGIPDTKYNCTVQMPSGEFQRIVRDLSVIGDTCTISCTKEGVTFSVSGDTGSGSVTRRQNTNADSADEKTVISMESPVSLTFALRYLNFFTKATPLGKSVRLCMSDEVPLVVEYKIGNIGYIRYYLAPKIDDDAS
eukprot:gb/GECG01016762.1/.p1 GENE.gb/GECG01016762.1/~~gb/GECG01016762.1/.p1  ORF type:complete len:261 (+),score=25.56 gb/GECG01016762.1/:1-783(+)